MSDTNTGNIPAVDAAVETTDTEVKQDPGMDVPSGKGAPDLGGAVKEAAAEAMRKYKVKVDGQELEVDENELKRGYSHQRAANKILQEGKLARMQAEKFIEALRDPEKAWEVLQKLGHDPDKLSESRLLRKIEEDSLDPREKEFRQTQAELKKYKEMEQRKAEAEAKAREDEIKAKYAQEYSNQFIEALKESRLPQNKKTVAEMARYVKEYAQVGIKIDAKTAARLVKEDMSQYVSTVFPEDTDPEIIVTTLGEKNVNKVRQHTLAQIKTPMDNLRTPTEQNQEPRKRSGNTHMSHKEWRKFNRG